MKYHIDGKRLPEWARSQIKPHQVTSPVHLLARFYCNLVYSFIEYGYVGNGRIETCKTRYAVRVYLAKKDKPTKLSGGLCNAYIRDLVEVGLAHMDNNKVVLNVPEELINKGALAQVAKAADLILCHGWVNLTRDALSQKGVSSEDCVEAFFALQSLFPEYKSRTKAFVREYFERVLNNNQ